MSNTINWHHSALERAPKLPAAWLVDTGERPTNLTERSALRRRIGHEVVAMQLGVPLRDIEISHDQAGKPLVECMHGAAIHISLATRGGIVAVALAHDPVGVDIELIEPAKHVPLDLLHPAEQAELLTIPASEQACHFAQIWTVKEAWLKALGTGLTRELASFAVAFGAKGQVQINDPIQDMRHPPLAATARIEKGGQLFAAALVVRN